MRLGRLSMIREYLNRRNQRRNRYRYGYREENAGVIRFNFMCSHTRDRPTSRSETGRYVMVSYESLLPVQGDSRLVAFRTGEANVKEHVWREVGTGKINGIGRTCSNNCSIK